MPSSTAAHGLLDLEAVKEKAVTQSSDERMGQLLALLQQNPGYAATMPSDEGAMVRDAMAGHSVYEIAQDHGTSEAAVWRVLGTAAQMASGNPPVRQVETGGFGSDTDPGVTGGYGETGFGSLSADIEPGVLDSEESSEVGGSNLEPQADGDQES